MHEAFNDWHLKSQFENVERMPERHVVLDFWPWARFRDLNLFIGFRVQKMSRCYSYRKTMEIPGEIQIQDISYLSEGLEN